MKFGLSEQQLDEIKAVIRAEDSITRVFIFGSRALGTFKEASDIDIAIDGEGINALTAAKLKARLEDETDVPFVFDIVAIPSVESDALLEHIKENGVAVFGGGGEWVDTTLEALVKFGNGKSRPKAIGSVPVYGGNGILDYTDSANYNGETIVIGRVGAYCGATYFENRPIWVSDNALSAKAKGENEVKFLFYHLKNLGLNKFAEGSSHPLVTQTLLNAIETKVPSDPKEQKAIAEVLSSLDDKIDLLHRQNKTLESLAETLFRHWFIDGAQDDWEPTSIGEIVTVKGGTTPSTKNPEFWDGDIYWTSPRDLSNQTSLYLFDTTRKITSAGLAQIGSGLMPVGTVLMSSRAPIGYLTIADIPVAVNQGYIAMVCDKSVSSHFVYLWCKANMEAIKNAGNGSTFEEISKSNFKALELFMPPPSLLSDFELQAAPVFQKIHVNSLQVLELRKIRDSLLPKLMSGDVRVDYEAVS